MHQPCYTPAQQVIPKRAQTRGGGRCLTKCLRSEQIHHRVSRVLHSLTWDLTRHWHQANRVAQTLRSSKFNWTYGRKRCCKYFDLWFSTLCLASQVSLITPFPPGWIAIHLLVPICDEKNYPRHLLGSVFSTDERRIQESNLAFRFRC